MNSKELSIIEEKIEVTPDEILSENDVIKKLVSGKITANQARKLLGYKTIQ